MLKYELKKKTNKPLYESLYKAIRSDILNGKLRAGLRLPLKRDMAADNQISLTTVMNAYQQLLMEGYIVSEEKKGYFVAHLHAMRPVERENTEYINKTHFFTNSTSSLEQYAVARFIEKGYYERQSIGSKSVIVRRGSSC